MKKRVWSKIILAAVAMTAVLTACGKANMSAGGAYEIASEAAYDTGAVYTVTEAAEAAAADYEYDEAPAAEEAVYEDGATEVPEAATGRKLIRNVELYAETEAFDELIPALQAQVEVLGGYIENIRVYDVSTYYVENRLEKQRNANITARVPQEKLDGFLSQVGQQTNVTSRSESVEDVTLQYVDLESHKKALLTEQERLLALMEQAESVEDIIAIEGRLSEVRYQIESMESQLRTYDNKIDYSTVYLSIEEVRKYSAPQTANVWQRIGTGFMKSLEDIGFGIRDFAIYFVIDLPYIILGLLGIVVAFFVLRALLKRFLRGRLLKEFLQKCRSLRFVRRGEDTVGGDRAGGEADAEDAVALTEPEADTEEEQE